MKSVLTHGLLAIAGLVMAYVVWADIGSEDGSSDSVTIWDCEKAQVKSVRLKTERKKVELAKREKGGDTFWWIDFERKKADDQTETEKFVGSDDVDEYLGRVAPLQAVRQLGAIEDKGLGKLGLKEAETTLAVSCGGKSRKFEVGDSAYGSGDRYARELVDGKPTDPVYLLPSKAISDLESANVRLMQRDLHRFEMTEVEKLEVNAFDNQRMLLQRNRQQPRKAQWVDADNPDKRNELFGNWLSRVHRLRVREYLAPDAKPGSDIEGVSVSKEKIMTLLYKSKDGEELGRLELVKADADPARFYARTEATRSWVQVPRSVAEQVERDVRPVVGLEPVSPGEDEGSGDSGADSATQTQSTSAQDEQGEDANAGGKPNKARKQRPTLPQRPSSGGGGGSAHGGGKPSKNAP